MNQPQVTSNLNQRAPKPAFYGSQGVVLQVIVLIVVSILVFWFLVRPKQSVVSAQSQQHEQLQETKEMTATTLAKLSGLVEQLDRAEAEVAKLDQLLPLDSRPTKIQVMLQRYVETSGMSLANVAVDFPPEEEIVAAGNTELLKEPFPAPRTRRVATVTLQANGLMSQFEVLLKSIESGSRLFDIKGIDIKGQEDGSIAARLKIHTYFYLP